MDKQTWIGIDIGKYKNTCSAPGKRPKMFKNNAKGTAMLLHHCMQVAPAHELFFVMEASGEYSNTCALTLLGLAETRVAITPPACVLGFIKSKIKRLKNDKADALAIREYAELAQPSEWLPPSKEQQRLRDLSLVLAVIAADETMSQDSKNMLSVPGIGPGVRNILMTRCYRQLKELSQKKLLSYSGMCPQENQSGKSRGKPG